MLPQLAPAFHLRTLTHISDITAGLLHFQGFHITLALLYFIQPHDQGYWYETKIEPPTFLPMDQEKSDVRMNLRI